MGFTTGFIGGFTLTSSILYLTLTLHQQNRLKQAIMLRQSSILLNGVVEPSPTTFIPPSARETRSGLADTAKDGWNRNVEGLFRWVQNTDWTELGREAEGKVGKMWRRAVDKVREEES
ncbi:hypothetical protein K490DRAFT_45346 [Saccharata proteae CBS 121410]|uniref:MICOS complex subunit MIC12 n=1 Tax=Saccharata proteae CBS 121410 TaxID=1314787 RepID=A0A9P4HSR1_9PEZI|nr:hypothetical protein K490DRAFT_45346 [Saccharata proteae CBS 121410]